MKHLPGLVPPVGQYAVLNIRLFQKRGIDERHTPAKEEEEEQVAGEFKIWLLREVEVSDAFDVSDRYGPLEGLLRSGEHRAEGPAVVGQPLLDGSVVNGPEDAHVKGYGVGGDFCRSQVSLIILQLPFPPPTQAGRTGIIRRCSIIGKSGMVPGNAIPHKSIHTAFFKAHLHSGAGMIHPPVAVLRYFFLECC